MQPWTGVRSVVIAAIAEPSRSRSAVWSSPSRISSSDSSADSGARAGSTQVDSESAFTASRTTGRRSPAPRLSSVSRVSASSCRASRSTSSPGSVGRTGRLRCSSTAPTARSSALSRWLTADGVTCSAPAAASRLPWSIVAANARS